MARAAQTMILTLASLTIGCGTDIIEAASLGDDQASESESASESDEVGESGTTGEASTGESTSEESTSESTSEESTSESTSEESTSESTSEESTSESTDTVVDTACQNDVSFMVPVTEFEGYGWTVTMSTLGEGMVISIPNMVNEALAAWDVEVPCDDTWHIWVRGIDSGNYDSYWARVDGQPMGWAVFDVDCSGAPFNDEIVYTWTELNWHDPNTPDCQYVEDPWTQDWNAGVHTIELGYRESWAISRIWVTNTNGTPP